MTRIARSLLRLCFTLVCLLAASTTARADFDVAIDTSSLSLSYSYMIELQFSQGGLNTSNTATVYGINFGTGSAGALSTATTSGSVTGNLLSLPIVMSFYPNTSYQSDDFTQAFTPGNTLQFSVSMTNYAETPGSYDTFGIDILYYDPHLNYWLPIATNDYNTNGIFLFEADTPGGGNPGPYASVNSSFVIPTPDVVATPAPSSLCLFLLGLPVLMLSRRLPTILRREVRPTGVV
jgi:hypothetical protein